MTRARVLAATVALLTTVLVACSPLPESGPVEVGEGPAPTSSAAPFDFNPPGPVQGADRSDIVAGFLRALQASPVSTTVAEEFLTSDAAASWRPELRTIVYTGQPVIGRQREVAVRLESTFELDRTGRWVSPGAQGPDRSLAFGLARREGEWRIATLPDATVIPRSHFETRYREYFLPFFDATASLVVPEQVYVPWGVQAPTMLVSALMAGPSEAGRPVERSFFPPGTRVGVGVPVREDGVAEVPLSKHVLDLGEEQLDLALAQLAWTLGQVGEVESFQVTVDGTPLELAGDEAGNVVDVDGWPQHAPWVASASSDLFGIRDDTVVQVGDDSEIDAVVLPRSVRRARSLGVDLAGQQFAVVTADGDRVVLLPRTSDGAARPSTVHRGTDVLRPMWDHTGRLWLLDRTATGPAVLVAHFGQVTRIPVPGLAEQEVLAAALSRDGTRMVVALAGAGASGDRLVMLRVVREASGMPVRLTAPAVLSTPLPLTRVQAVAWRDPTTVAALTRPTRTTSEVVLASSDGSSGLIDLDSAADVLFESGVSLAASPAPPLALVVGTRDAELHGLDAQGRWDFDSAPVGLRLPAFVG